MRALRAALLALPLAASGCGPLLAPGRAPSDFDVAASQSPAARPYAPGSLLFADTPSSGARRAGCLDVRVEAVRAAVPGDSVALAFMVGNRCMHAVRVALADASVRAAWSGGERSLALYDPASGVHAPFLDAGTDATEILRYAEPPGSPAGPARAVCVDVSRVAADEPSPGLAPICLSRTGRFANEDTIVGHPGFAAERWRRSPFHMLVETGVGVNLVDPRATGLHFSGWSVVPPGGHAIAVSPSAFKAASTYVLDERMAWLIGPFYLGEAAQFGAGPFDAGGPLSVGGTATRVDGYLADISVGALAGVVWTRSTSTRLRSDVTLGLRAFGSDVFPPGCGSSSCTLPLAAGLPIVTPRVVLDRWVGRHFSISAWLTADALHLPDFGAGVSLGVHPWAYDGLP